MNYQEFKKRVTERFADKVLRIDDQNKQIVIGNTGIGVEINYRASEMFTVFCFNYDCDEYNDKTSYTQTDNQAFTEFDTAIRFIEQTFVRSAQGYYYELCRF